MLRPQKPPRDQKEKYMHRKFKTDESLGMEDVVGVPPSFHPDRASVMREKSLTTAAYLSTD
jgi:hypothetical protein